MRDERGRDRMIYCKHFSIHQREILYFDHVKRPFSKCLLQAKCANFFSRRITEEETIRASWFDQVHRVGNDRAVLELSTFEFLSHREMEFAAWRKCSVSI